MDANKRWEIPFYDLFAELSNNGFAVEITDFQECVEILKNYDPLNIDEIQIAKIKMASVICRNAEEQRKFYVRFDAYIEEKKLQLKAIKKIEDDKIEVDKQKKKKYLRWALFSIISILLIVSGYFWIKTIESPYSYSSSYPDHFVIGEPVQFNSIASTDGKLSPLRKLLLQIAGKPIDSTQVKVNWDFGDGSPVTNILNPTHTFADTGLKVIHVDFNSSVESVQHTDTILVCDVSPNLDLLSDEAILNEDYQLTRTDDNTNRAVKWTIDGDSTKVTFNKTITHQFSTEGNHTIGAKFADQSCPHDKIKTISVNNPEKFYLEANSTPFTPEITTTIPRRTYIAGILTLLLIGVLLAVRNFLKKAWKDKEDQKKSEVTKEPTFTGQKPPFDLNFINRDELIHVKSVQKWSRDLNKSISTDRLYLDLKKTIRSTINNEDLFTPEYSNIKSTRKFIFLIDRGARRNTQTELFRFIVKKLEQYQVNLEWYYYDSDPEFLFDGKSENPININRLQDLNYQSVLVVWGTGYGFKIPGRQLLREDLITTYSRWDVRILLTPTTFQDWSLSESVLSEFFKVIPADENELPGLLAYLDNLINDATNEIAKRESYPVKNIQFEDVEVLKQYFENDMELFHCVCALAVYPKVRWPLLLQIVSAVASHKLNYTDLLKISRISWIQSGNFSARLRLELLKQLPVNMELKAREAVISLLEQTPTPTSDYTSNEKYLQLLINKFILFSHDREKYNQYSDAEKEFLHLYKADKFTDIPLSAYLEKSDPENQSNLAANNWSTPVNSVTSGNNTTIKEYWKEKFPVSKFKTLIDFPIAALIIILAIGLLSFQLKDNLPLANNISSLLVTQTTALPENLNVIFNKDSCYLNFSKNEPVRFRIFEKAFDETSGIASLSPITESVFTSTNLSWPIFANKYNTPVVIELENSDGNLITYNSVIDSDSLMLNVSSPSCSILPEQLVNIYYTNPDDAANAYSISRYLQSFNYKIGQSNLIDKNDISYLTPPFTSEISSIDSMVNQWIKYYASSKSIKVTYKNSDKGNIDLVLESNSKGPRPFICNKNKEANYVIYYNEDLGTITPRSNLILDNVLKQLNENPGSTVRFGSHCEEQNTGAFNNAKSLMMSNNLGDYLKRNGIDSARIITEGFGESFKAVELIDGDEVYNKKARDCNRRTEIFISIPINPQVIPVKKDSVLPPQKAPEEAKEPSCITITETSSLYSQKEPERVCAINLNLEGTFEPEALMNFRRLRSLTLNGRKLQSSMASENGKPDNQQLRIPSSIEQLTMTYLQIVNINFVNGLNNLDSLNLSNNFITDMYPLMELYKLRVLNISHNKISKLDPLMKMESITELDLSFNNITDISPLMKMSNLRKVNLTGNEKLGKSIDRLRKELPKLEIIYAEPGQKSK